MRTKSCFTSLGRAVRGSTCMSELAVSNQVRPRWGDSRQVSLRQGFAEPWTRLGVDQGNREFGPSERGIGPKRGVEGRGESKPVGRMTRAEDRRKPLIAGQNGHGPPGWADGPGGGESVSQNALNWSKCSLNRNCLYSPLRRYQARLEGRAVANVRGDQAKPQGRSE